MTVPASFSEIVGEPLFTFIAERPPRKVLSRVGKADDHYRKALALRGIDEEMGAIRLIAAEEELVVAIFEIIKLNASQMPEHEDFVRRFKNHYVKLAFHPVLQQFVWILERWFASPFEIDGLDNSDVSLAVDPATMKVELRVSLEGRDPVVLNHNPLHSTITLEDKPPAEVVDSIFEELTKRVVESGYPDLRTFLSRRAEYRNDLLYAQDGGSMEMGENLDDILAVVIPAYRDLLWCVALLIAHQATKEDWGLAAQFIAVYRRFLQAAKLA